MMIKRAQGIACTPSRFIGLERHPESIVADEPGTTSRRLRNWTLGRRVKRKGRKLVCNNLIISPLGSALTFGPNSIPLWLWRRIVSNQVHFCLQFSADQVPVRALGAFESLMARKPIVRPCFHNDLVIQGKDGGVIVKLIKISSTPVQLHHAMYIGKDWA